MKLFFAVLFTLPASIGFAEVSKDLSNEPMKVQCASRVVYTDHAGSRHMVKGPSVLENYRGVRSSPQKGILEGSTLEYFVLNGGDGKHAELIIARDEGAALHLTHQIRGVVTGDETIDALLSYDREDKPVRCRVRLFGVVCAETIAKAEMKIAKYGVFKNPEEVSLPKDCEVEN